MALKRKNMKKEPRSLDEKIKTLKTLTLELEARFPIHDRGNLNRKGRTNW